MVAHFVFHNKIDTPWRWQVPNKPAGISYTTNPSQSRRVYRVVDSWLETIVGEEPRPDTPMDNVHMYLPLLKSFMWTMELLQSTCSPVF